MNYISSAALPVMIILILVFALIKKIPVYDAFIKGAENGLHTALGIMPSLIALVTAVSMFKASGALDIICHFVAPVTNLFSFPSEVLPMAILRPVSGSGSTALLKNILDTYGADSFAGRVASVISGSTETTFYTLSVYFAAVNVSKTRHTLKSALLADLTGILLGAAVVSLFL